MSRATGAAALGALALLAVLLRGHDLGSPELWVDEAESAINALTIVADGVPGDRFLGQPIYENTLVRPWPESPEYEFRDISYSDRGLAVYHAWLPLYAIAGAFRLAGVTPEQARHGTPLRDGSPEEIRHWTAVPRWPSLVFSALFVVAAFGLGRAVQGAPVGWALAFTAATANVLVWFGRQARYYSATLAGNAACGLAVWNACRRGRLSDHALAGLAIGILFHVHSLSAVTMAAVYAAALRFARRQPRLWLRALTAGAVSGALVLPWAAWSGMLGHSAHIPPARDYVDPLMLLWSLPTSDPVVLSTAVLGLAWLALARLGASWLPERWRRSILDESAGMRFALAWLAIAYTTFVGLVPAASYFVERLKLVVAVPGALLITLVVAAVCRALRPSSHLLPTAGMAALLLLAGQLPPRLLLETPDLGFADLVRAVRSWDVGPGGRLFASPNDHLPLTYYSGRPVQSVAPVRREWLDRFAGGVVVIEGPWFDWLSPEDVQAVGRGLGRALTRAEATFHARDASRLATIHGLLASGLHVVSPPPPPDDLDRALVEQTRLVTRRNMDRLSAGHPLGHTAMPSNWRGWWHAFFYWFSEPGRRSGEGLNYRGCRDRARVQVHRSGFVVYDCRVSSGPPLLSNGVGVSRQQ